ncbi:MAG: restriction endonuclease subunit S [Myxococcota bacterium]
MSTSWPTIPLSKTGKWLSGGTPARKNEAFWGGSIPWIGTKDLKGFDLVDSSEYITDEAAADGARVIEPGAVLFVTRGMSLAKEFRVGVAGVRLSFNQDVKAIVPRKDIDGRFLAWFLVASERDILARVDTASHGTKRLPLERIEGLPVPLPPLPEQRRIAAILDEADALRRQRSEALVLLDELLRSAFMEMFGDPVTNPRGWPIVEMRQLIVDSQYGTAEKANTDGEGLPVLRMNNLGYDGSWNLSDLKHVQVADADFSKLTVRRGDLLFNRTNSPELVGKTGVWELDEPFAFAGYLIRIRFDEDRVLPDYVSSYLNSVPGKRYLFERAKPSNNMSNFSASMFAEIPLGVPPLPYSAGGVRSLPRTGTMSPSVSARASRPTTCSTHSSTVRSRVGCDVSPSPGVPGAVRHALRDCRERVGTGSRAPSGADPEVHRRPPGR